MANALDALIDRIPDEALRGQIREALKKQNQQKKFGLVFEDHIPESTVLYDVPVKAGSTVALRGGDVSKQMKVLAIDGEVPIAFPCRRGSLWISRWIAWYL